MVLATVAALSLTAIGVIVWSAVFNQHDSTGGHSSTEPNSTAPSSLPSSVDKTPSVMGASKLAVGADGLAACVAEVAAAETEVATARVGIGHWAEHIQARTDLLSGNQPKAVTKAIWKRTREAGPADLTRHQQAVAEHTRRSGACASAARDDNAGAVDAARLVACQQRLQVLDTAVTAGAAGMGDWKAHQDAMTAHKAGEIDAAHAQHLWLAAWSAAPKNISAFHSADTALRSATACPS